MSIAFIGEIKLFAGTFAPRNWLFCQGQELAVAQNQALYAILGQTYGGNGSTTFKLPDLRGRAPVHPQPSPTPVVPGTITNIALGYGVGSTTSAPIAVPLPPHTHTATFAGTGGSPAVANTLAVSVTLAAANTSTGAVGNPEGNVPAVIKSGMTSLNAYVAPASATGTLGGVTVSLTGDPGHPATGFTGGNVTVSPAGSGSQTTATVVPPSLALNYIICVAGLFPVRT